MPLDTFPHRDSRECRAGQTGASRQHIGAAHNSTSGGASPEPSLSAALKQHTREAHRRAETSGIIRQLVRRQASREGYIAYLANLHPVYRAMEQRFARLTRHPPFDTIAHPALHRQRAIENDLDALASNSWRSGIALQTATRAYIRRIDDADEAQLAAHAYVRYLGDLNGGAIIKRLLRDSLALGEAELMFYEFGGIADRATFCDQFRAALDSLPTRYDADSFLNEALVGFRLATEQSIEVEASTVTIA